MSKPDLPTGTVTFLFSDMAGSTRLVAELGPTVFTDVLERHHTVLRAAFGAHGGTERGTQGDSFLVMFAEAPAALAAAADAQRALAAVDWPKDARVRVRMGIHTGLGTLGGDDYVGLDVNRAARIAAAAHGGQVLVSDATRALAEAALPAGTSLAELGEYTLRDLGRPERLFQLVIEGLQPTFPPILALDRSGSNLPERLTSFVGRDRDLTNLRELLAASRLLTLTGPGGTGKTSLAIELARSAADAFADGAWFIPLDAVRDPALVDATMATALGLFESPDGGTRERLLRFLARRSLLLVVDNFEHLLAAAPLAGEILRGAPGVRIIVTSRAALRVGGEQEYPVEPLALPDPDAPAADAAVAAAVQLFVERARQVRPDYRLTPEDTEAVADICRRLDGLPLGIELAASRLALLPPQAIAERLARRLDLPGEATRDAPTRQRSLGAALGWSYDLLEPPAQHLLVRLSVFAGGCRLEEAEAVCGPPSDLGSEVIDGLAVLVDHSLVQPTPGPDGARFRLLETIRLFATERLAEAGDSEALRRRHAVAYLGLAERAARHMPARGQIVWLDRLSADHDNLRAALGYAIDAGDGELAYRLAAGLWRFWQLRGHVEEGRRLTARVLAMPAAAPAGARMRALEAAGGLAWWSADIPAADAHYVAQLAMAEDLGDRQGIADALFNLHATRFAAGRDEDELERLRQRSIALYRELGDSRSEARTRFAEAWPLLVRGEHRRARDLVLDLLPTFEQRDDEFYVALAVQGMSLATAGLGDLPEALHWAVRSIRSNVVMGDAGSAIFALRASTLFLLAMDLPHEAATVHGAYLALCERHGVTPPISLENAAALGWTAEEAAAALGADVYAPDVARGQAMSLEEAAHHFIEAAEPRVGDPPVSPDRPR